MDIDEVVEVYAKLFDVDPKEMRQMMVQGDGSDHLALPADHWEVPDHATPYIVIRNRKANRAAGYRPGKYRMPRRKFKGVRHFEGPSTLAELLGEDE